MSTSYILETTIHSKVNGDGQSRQTRWNLKLGDNIHKSKKMILIACDKCYARGSTGHYVSTKERHTT